MELNIEKIKNHIGFLAVELSKSDCENVEFIRGQLSILYGLLRGEYENEETDILSRF